MRELNIKKVNLADKFQLFSDYWTPKIVGDLNDSYIKLAKFKGDFTWHKHVNEDELFLVVKGILVIELRNNEKITLHPGEFVIIPKNTEHKPVAKNEVEVMLIELKSTINTGDAEDNRRVDQLDWI